MSKVQCPKCGKNYDYIGVHWSKSCGFPTISNNKKEILEGLLMGDAWIKEASGTNNICILEIAGTERKFLEHLHQQLSPFTTGVKFYKSGEKIASSASDAGMNAKASNTKDQYILKSRSHPYFDELRKWYSPDKSFPNNINLTRTKMKYWYLCDGYVVYANRNNKDANGHIRFAASNEDHRVNWLHSLFDKYDVQPKQNEHFVRFNCEDSVKLLEHMGQPVDGYQHKWIVNDYEKYYEVKNE